ncbi:unnamed protein product [Protopolystoma xenopodis]|uniref:Androglobin domain-containing protein n=1 Tax=Protopolystoma xenopodis TaxID=117903 RepID=A0A3S5BN35_9PLAT|nr:unnamed protein product [Protopolystoma xenopodis]
MNIPSVGYPFDSDEENFITFSQYSGIVSPVALGSTHLLSSLKPPTGEFIFLDPESKCKFDQIWQQLIDRATSVSKAVEQETVKAAEECNNLFHQPSGTWLQLLFRHVFHSFPVISDPLNLLPSDLLKLQRPTPVVPQFICDLPNSFLTIVDNDTGKHYIHTPEETVSTRLFLPNQNGYTFIGLTSRLTTGPLEGNESSPPPVRSTSERPNGRWRLRLLNGPSDSLSASKPPSLRPDGYGIQEEGHLVCDFHEQTIVDYYTPNKNGLLFSQTIKVSIPTLTHFIYGKSP